jgi:hypothetical protein
MKDEASYEQVPQSLSINKTCEIESIHDPESVFPLIHTPYLMLLWLDGPTIVLVHVDTSFSRKFAFTMEINGLMTNISTRSCRCIIVDCD